MATLTKEQKIRIEKNRLAALERRKLYRLKNQTQSNLSRLPLNRTNLICCNNKNTNNNLHQDALIIKTITNRKKRKRKFDEMQQSLTSSTSKLPLQLLSTNTSNSSGNIISSPQKKRRKIQINHDSENINNDNYNITNKQTHNDTNHYYNIDKKEIYNHNLLQNNTNNYDINQNKCKTDQYVKQISTKHSHSKQSNISQNGQQQRNMILTECKLTENDDSDTNITSKILVKNSKFKSKSKSKSKTKEIKSSNLITNYLHSKSKSIKKLNFIDLTLESSAKKQIAKQQKRQTKRIKKQTKRWKKSSQSKKKNNINKNKKNNDMNNNNNKSYSKSNYNNNKNNMKIDKGIWVPTSKEVLFTRLSHSKFRSKFKLGAKEINIVQTKDMDIIEKHAFDFVRKRLSAAYPKNDGKQTPMRGHPVFIAQHATATCCRTCLSKWHFIPIGNVLTNEQIIYMVEVILHWITLKCPINRTNHNH